MSNRELVFLSATELASKIRHKEVSPVEAVEAYLERSTEIDPKLNASITVLADEALAEARQSQADVAVVRAQGRLLRRGSRPALLALGAS